MMYPYAIRLLAWFGIVAPILRTALILGLGYLQPGYSQARDFISELGAREAPYAAVMNYAGLVPVGAFLCVFAISPRLASRPGFLPWAGATLLMISGLAFIAVGLFPCDPGCSGESPTETMKIHMLAGIVGMTAQTLAALSFGLRFASDRRRAVVSLVLGLVGLVGLGFLTFGVGWLKVPGLAQKTCQGATDMWVLISAGFILRKIARPATASVSRGI